MQSIILASASPRRSELFKRICSEFDVLAADIDETPLVNENPEALVMRLAQQKAQCVFNKYPSAVVLGSDTLIACDEWILGKPKDQEDFMAMMSRLSDRSHKVHTAVAVVSSKQQLCCIVTSDVSFAHITEAEALAYWHSGEPQDKAGGYAIQGLGEQFVTHISGSYSAIVGLPLYETKRMLETFR